MISDLRLNNKKTEALWIGSKEHRYAMPGERIWMAENKSQNTRCLAFIGPRVNYKSEFLRDNLHPTQKLAIQKTKLTWKNYGFKKTNRFEFCTCFSSSSNKPSGYKFYKFLWDGKPDKIKRK